MKKFKFSKCIAANVAKPAKVPVNKGFEPANVLLRFAKVTPESPAPAKILANISNTLAKENTCKISSFSDFSNISKDDSVKIEKMSVCLDGKPCSYLYVKDMRQMCRRNNKPVFDMDECPMGKWHTCGKISGGNDTRPETKESLWCSTTCPDGERREIEGMPVLWCQVSDQAVIDLSECPRGHWLKNSEGRPVDQSLSGSAE